MSAIAKNVMRSISPAWIMEQDAVRFIQEQRRFIGGYREPVVVSLYGNCGYAKKVAPWVAIHLEHGRMAANLMDVSSIRLRAQMIAPSQDTYNHIINPVCDGAVRVISVGFGFMMVYDLDTCLIFSMLN